MIEFSDGFEEAPRARRELVERVEPLVAKYMQILNVDAAPRVVVRDNMGSRWLGRTMFWIKNPTTSTIELQRQVFEDDRTLERIIAHEMIHHSDYLSFDERTLALLRAGIKPPGHGATFLKKAEQINKIMGEDYVTKTSDQTYSLPEETTRPYYLLIYPLQDGRFGYRWGVRVTHQSNMRVRDAVLNRNAVLVASRDTRWTHGSAKLGDTMINVPRVAAEQAELKQMHEEGSELTTEIRRSAPT